MIESDALPSGLVTFVITDIEGSTKLFRRLGEAYPVMLDEHNSLLREQWKAHGGVEVKTAGDSFIVAFASASDALAAAVAAQRAVACHRWPDGVVLCIRIGVHSGVAFPRNGDYVSLALHQAARLVGAANGGQVLASADTVNAAGADPPVRIETIGAFRLRDFDGAVRLSAVAAPDESIDHPVAVRAVPADGHNLVAPLTSLVGRAREIGDVRERLGPGRLVSIVGAGGMGKTRLAIEVGRRVAPAWPDGVWMIDLSTVSDARLVAAAVADDVGAAVTDGDEHAAVLAHFARRAALLILDNCEHLVAGASGLAQTLLGQCPGVGIMATSRVPLATPGEEVWRLEPLGLDDESAQLFLDRARSHAPGFASAEDDRDVIVEICRRLDGMPLAIELAAARVAVLSPGEILDGLDRRFRLLRTNDPTTTARQQSLRALLDWGYELLGIAEQSALARLSVFRGSFDLTLAAAAIGHGTIDPDDVPELVWSLTDQSFLTVDRSQGASRYRLLETVRAYASDRLVESEDAPDVRARLAAHYLDCFPWAKVTTRASLAGLTLETDTVVALVDELLDDGRTDDGLALARLVAVLRHVQGRLLLAYDELARAIRRARPPATMLARAHLAAALVATSLGRLDDADAHRREAARLVDEFGAEDRWGHVSVARTTAEIAMRRGATEAMIQARDQLRIELAGQLTPSDRTDTLMSLGETLGALGDPDVIDVLTEGVALARATDDDAMLCIGLATLAEHAMRNGETSLAARHQRESLQLAAELGSPIATAFALIIAARIAQQFEMNETAVPLHAAADLILEQAGYELAPGDRALSDAMHAQALTHLGSDRYTALDREGRNLTLQRAIQLADGLLEQAATG